MADLIAWCGFIGAWLLVMGPLNQAIREVQEEEFERASVERVQDEIGVPPPVSPRWLILPPVYLVLRGRRNRVFREQVRGAMPSEDVRALAHLRDVATAWFLVAAGASLLAVSETWGLVEAYGWGRWTFWALILGMSALSAAGVALRIGHRDRF